MRFTLINENELVEYLRVQNRKQILKEFQVFYRMAALNISEKSLESFCGGVLQLQFLIRISLK